MSNQKRRNHYIPRVLLNRFASWSDQKRGKYKTWCYSKEWGVKEISTKDVALGAHFYGKDGNLEDRLSKIESQLGKTLAEIDEGRPVAHFDKFLSEYAWVQAVRTRSFRVRVTRTMSDLMARFAEGVVTEDAKPFLLTQGEQSIREELSKLTPEQLELARSKLGGVSVDQFSSALLNMAVNSGYLSTYMQSALRYVSQSSHLSDAFSNGLNKGISNIVEGGKISPDNFQAHWTDVRVLKNLILGDSCIVTQRVDLAWQPVSDAVNWNVLYFPIRADRCLFGYRESSIQPPKSLDADVINTASAKCSIQQFFSSANDGHLLELVPAIDSNTDVLSETEKADIAKSAWQT